MASTPTNAQLHIKPLFATPRRAVITLILTVAILIGLWADLTRPTIGPLLVLPPAAFIVWAYPLQRAEYRKRGIRWPV